MLARIVSTAAAVGFAIGAFCGAGPTQVGPPNPFGLFFLGIAALIWFAWKPLSRGLGRTGAWDAVSGGFVGTRDDRGPVVPEADWMPPRRRG